MARGPPFVLMPPVSSMSPTQCWDGASTTTSARSSCGALQPVSGILPKPTLAGCPCSHVYIISFDTYKLMKHECENKELCCWKHTSLISLSLFMILDLTLLTLQLTIACEQFHIRCHLICTGHIRGPIHKQHCIGQCTARHWKLGRHYFG